VIRVFARGRAILAPVGDALAAAGRIAAADDIWFLTIPDARRAVAGEDLRDVVAARRSEYRRELRRRHVARVMLSPAGARLEPGEVLVAPATDPGWTPLFLTASALVMEMGGMMSHGAVVAREYGIPAVVGVPDATTRIATGERIVVDGSAGTVAPEGR